MAENQVELPEKFLKRWLRVSNEGKLSDEQIEAEFPAFADNLRWTLLRDKIKELHHLEVTEEDVQAEFAHRVRNYFQGQVSEEIVRSSVERLMKTEKDVENTRRDLETDKIFEAVRQQITVADKAVPSEEFHKILEEITQKAKTEQGVMSDE